VSSTTACCQACQSFSECSYFTYYKSNQQCVIKSNLAASPGPNSATDSGSRTANYTRPTTCSQQSANTDFHLQTNLGSFPASSASDCCTMCTKYYGCNYWTLSGSTCYLKANQGQIKSGQSGFTSGVVIPESTRNTTLRTGKRGLALFGTQSCADISLLTGTTWVYNWGTNPGLLEECFLQLGIEFVPMIWGSTADFSSVYLNSSYLLTFNEPNFSQQSNLSPAQAAALWPQIEAVAAKNNMKISSPSASYGGDRGDPIAWLHQFFGNCSKCKVDFITTHQYDCNAAGLHGAMTNFKQFNLPIWVTEFACWGSSVSQEVSFLQSLLPMFDGDASIARYSYFGARSAGGSVIDVFDHTKCALSPVGTTYV